MFQDNNTPINDNDDVIKALTNENQSLKKKIKQLETIFNTRLKLSEQEILKQYNQKATQFQADAKQLYDTEIKKMENKFTVEYFENLYSKMLDTAEKSNKKQSTLINVIREQRYVINTILTYCTMYYDLNTILKTLKRFQKMIEKDEIDVDNQKLALLNRLSFVHYTLSERKNRKQVTEKVAEDFFAALSFLTPFLKKVHDKLTPSEKYVPNHLFIIGNIASIGLQFVTNFRHIYAQNLLNQQRVLVNRLNLSRGINIPRINDHPNSYDISDAYLEKQEDAVNMYAEGMLTDIESLKEAMEKHLNSLKNPMNQQIDNDSANTSMSDNSSFESSLSSIPKYGTASMPSTLPSQQAESSSASSSTYIPPSQSDNVDDQKSIHRQKLAFLQEQEPINNDDDSFSSFSSDDDSSPLFDSFVNEAIAKMEELAHAS